MSVPVSKRTLSDMQFYTNAIELRKDITLLLLRDFGIKNRVKDISFMEHYLKMTQQDALLLEELMIKYAFGKNVIDQFPDWIVNHIRDCIISSLFTLVSSIVKAYSIYPATDNELYHKKSLQNNAVGAIETIIQDFQYAAQIFPVDHNKFMPFILRLIEEEKLIKGWKKSTTDVYRKYKASRSDNNKENFIKTGNNR